MLCPPRSLAALLAAHDRLRAAGVDHLVVGGCARALLDEAPAAGRRPRDVDLEVSPADVARAGAALGARVFERADAAITSLQAGLVVAGVEVDVGAIAEVRGPLGTLAGDWGRQWGARRTVLLAGRTLAVGPTAEMIARALVAGDGARLLRCGGAGPWPDPGYVAARVAAAISSATS
ncbi:MAG: hypothetical protein RIB67_10570 [Miltoncostaeaceae bacterium]